MQIDASTRDVSFTRFLAERAFGLLIFSALAPVAWMSVRAAVADLQYRENTTASLHEAVVLEPGNAAYHALLAEHLEGEGVDPSPQLKAAIELSPLDSQYLIRMATQAEAQNDFATAQGYLERAVAVDRKFLPRWSLLNFYFRRNNLAEFWSWFPRALGMSGDNSPGVFRLAWEVTSDAAAIFERLPRSESLLMSYLGFLLETQRNEAARHVAVELARTASPEAVNLLISYCERTLRIPGQSPLEVWNTLARRKLIPLAGLDPASGQIISNPHFTNAMGQRGFDWRMPQIDGIVLSPSDDSRGIQLSFDGSEPEDCVALLQFVPLSKGIRYRIGYQFSSTSGESLAGLSWEILDGRATISSAPLAVDSQSKAGQLEFTATGSTGELQLHYRRPPGQVRAAATVVIRDIASQIEPNKVTK